MKKTKVTCIDTEKTLDADILKKSSKLLEVAVDGSNLKLKLTKNTPDEKIYIGRMSGLEFTSTGE
jgi:hypothetical protein